MYKDEIGKNIFDFMKEKQKKMQDVRQDIG